MARAKLGILMTVALWTAPVWAVHVTGCGQSPPGSVSYDPDFSEPELATLRASVGAWCDAVGWCPPEVTWSERGRFILVDHIKDTNGSLGACPEDRECTVSGKNKEDNILVARDRAAPDDMAVLYTLVVHEIGHYCMGHLDAGVMAAVQSPENGALGVDQAAIDAWRDGCF